MMSEGKKEINKNKRRKGHRLWLGEAQDAYIITNEEEREEAAISATQLLQCPVISSATKVPISAPSGLLQRTWSRGILW